MSIDSSHITAQLKSWYQRKNGDYVLSSLHAYLQPILDTSFGYHILQLGGVVGAELYAQSPITHRIHSSVDAEEGVTLVANDNELPLDSDSIDTLIAHHCLEFDSSPHKVLREIHRVLAPQGNLFIIGFNPNSLLGLKANVGRYTRHPLWQSHTPISRHRMIDWLRVLGCELESYRYLYSLPPVGRGRIHSMLGQCDAWLTQHNVPTGGLYVLHATKQVSAINRPRSGLLRRGERLIGLSVPKPRAAPSPTPIVPTTTNTIKNTGDNTA